MFKLNSENNFMMGMARSMIELKGANSMPKTRLKFNLTPKQDRFCREYVIDHNGTRAWMASHPSCKSERAAEASASHALSKDIISSRIEELEIPIADKLGVTLEYVLQGLKDVYARSMQAEPVMIYNRKTQRMEESGEYTFDSTGANRALELMGKHRAMFTDKVDNTTKVKGLKQAAPNIIVSSQKGADVLRALIGGDANAATTGDAAIERVGA